MKTAIIYLIVISFLFQSCYSYRTIDLKSTQLNTEKEYKIRQDARFVKVKLEKVNDSVLTVLEGTSRKDIPISSIKGIKEQKFSTLKTTGLVLSSGFVVLCIIGGIAMSDSGFGDFEIAEN